MNPEALLMRPEDVDSEERRFDTVLDRYAVLRARRDNFISYGKSLFDHLLGRPSDLDQIDDATVSLVEASHLVTEARTRLRTQHVVNPDQYTDRYAEAYAEEQRNLSDDTTEVLQEVHTTQGVWDVIYRGYLNLDWLRMLGGATLVVGGSSALIQGPNAALAVDLGIVVALPGAVDFARRTWLEYTTRHQDNVLPTTRDEELIRRRESMVEGLVTGDYDDYPVIIDQELEERSRLDIRTALRRNFSHILGVPNSIAGIIRQRGVVRSATSSFDEELPELNRSFERARKTRALRWVIALGTLSLVFLHGQARPEDCGWRNFTDPDNVVGADLGTTNVSSFTGIAANDQFELLQEGSFDKSNPQHIQALEGLERKEPEFTIKLREEIVDIINWKNNPTIRISKDLFVQPDQLYNACPGEIRGAINRASR